jgi:hypothetical protein
MAELNGAEAVHKSLFDQPEQSVADGATVKMFDEYQSLRAESSLVGKVTTSVFEDYDGKQNLALNWSDKQGIDYRYVLDKNQTVEVTIPMSGCSGPSRAIAIFDSSGRQILDARSLGNVNVVDRAPTELEKATDIMSPGIVGSFGQNVKSLYWCDNKGNFIERSLAPGSHYLVKPLSDK